MEMKEFLRSKLVKDNKNDENNWKIVNEKISQIDDMKRATFFRHESTIFICDEACFKESFNIKLPTREEVFISCGFFVMWTWWLYKRPTVLNCAFIVVPGINERSTIMSMFLISMKQNYISLLPWDKTHILQVIFLTLFRLIVWFSAINHTSFIRKHKTIGIICLFFRFSNHAFYFCFRISY